MVTYIILAIVNGIIIGISRTINGKLSNSVGPFQASFWNHMIGFVFLTLILIIVGQLKFNINLDAPFISYFGGFFGAIFVAINSYVFLKIGATKTVLLVISGQMISSVLINHKHFYSLSTLAQLIGVITILLGIYLAKSSDRKREKIQ